MTKCLRCGGSGKDPVNYKEDKPEDCVDCKGKGKVELTDKTIRLPEDAPDSPVHVTYKLNGEVIGRGRTLAYKPAQWLLGESGEGEIKRGNL